MREYITERYLSNQTLFRNAPNTSQRKYPKANIVSDGKMTPSGIPCGATAIRADYHFVQDLTNP